MSGSQVVLASALASAVTVLVGRNATRLASTVAATRAAVPGAQLDTIVFDLSSLASVRAGAASLVAKHPAIDVLVNNAGGLIEGPVTADGFNPMFEVMNIGPALLTKLCLQALERANGRVVNVASASSFEPLWLVPGHTAQDMMGYARGKPALSGGIGYGVSKLLVVHYTAQLNVRLNSTVKALSVNPGLFRTEPYSLQDHLICDTVMRFRPCPQTPAQGAAGIAFAALVPGAAQTGGAMIDFETKVDALGAFTQSGDSCVPRPMPKWDAAEAAKFYDLVQAAIGAA